MKYYSVLILFFISIYPYNLLASDIKSSVSNECQTFLDETKELKKREREQIRASSHIKRSFLWENDSFLSSGQQEDRHYTNGMKLTWVYNPCRNKHEYFKGKYGSVLNYFSNGDRELHTAGLFGMNMYTPNSITEINRNLDDRPYAGWMYVGYLFQSRELDIRDSHNSLELQIGAIGPVTGQEEVQTWVHEHITDSDTPLGWEYQIQNQIGFNAVYMHRTNFYPFELGTDNKLLRVIPHLGFSVGNVTDYVNAGALVLLGPSGRDLPVLSIQPGLIEGDGVRNRRWEYYIYIGIDYRYYAYNLFIEGTGEARHNISMIPGVYDVLAGFSIKPSSWCDCKLSYKIINRSKEFNSNNKSLERSHRIGQINFEWYY